MSCFVLMVCFLSFSGISVYADEFSKGAAIHSLDDLSKRIAEAKPGDEILLEEGHYTGSDCVLSGKGTESQPVVVRARTTGSVTFADPVLLESDYVVLEGIQFVENGNLEILGTGCRITRCTWTDVQVGKWVRVRPGSKQIEIGYCRFQDKTDNLDKDRGCQLMQIVVRNEGERHHIHHNHFVDVPKGKSNNGYETLQLITENNPFDPMPGDCETVIEDNLFERCNGEAEVISVKSNGNILRRNTFRASRGALVLRKGDGNVVSQSFFLGDGESGSGGVRLQGQDQVVVNNLFSGLGKFGVAMMDGTPDGLYIRTERALLAFNTFVDISPSLEIGVNHSKHPNGTAPEDCVIANNAFAFRGNGFGEGLPTVRFVKNDEPVNWVWEGNITEGSLGILDRQGFRIGSLELLFLPTGLAIPGEKSVLTGAAAGEYHDIIEDAAGQSRGQQKTIGCFEPSSTGSTGPLLAGDVGPRAGL